VEADRGEEVDEACGEEAVDVAGELFVGEAVDEAATGCGDVDEEVELALDGTEVDEACGEEAVEVAVEVAVVGAVEEDEEEVEVGEVTEPLEGTEGGGV